MKWVFLWFGCGIVASIVGTITDEILYAPMKGKRVGFWDVVLAICLGPGTFGILLHSICQWICAKFFTRRSNNAKRK